MLYRRRAKQPQAAGGTDAQQAWQALPDDFQSDAAPPDERTEHELLRRAVELLRSEFEQQTWQAFWLATIDHRPAAEIAQQLGLTPGAVRQAKYRVLKRLREFMDED
jgi:RNA polymerase sigma-70 factor (ECF subfamily)